jgi:hypothetical protein
VSFFLHISLIVFAFFIGLGFVFGVRWLHLNVLPEGGTDQSPLYLLGLFALLAAVLATLYRLYCKRIAPPAFFLGGALLIFALVLASSKWLAGGSYLLAWPLIAGVLATAVAAFRPGHLSVVGACVLCLLSLPTLLLMVPLLQGFYTALGFTPTTAPLLSVNFGLLFLLLFPFLEPVLESGGKLVPLLALAVAVVLCIYAGLTTRYSPGHPKPSLLAYALDADTGKALWTSSAARVDSWTAQYVGTTPARAKLPDFYPGWVRIDFLQHDAPVISLPAPRAELLEKSADGDTRTLRLRISTLRHARVIHVGVAQAEVLSASVNGHDLGKPSEARWHQSGQWSFDYANPPTDGIDVRLRLQGTGPATLVLVDRSSGLPAIRGANLPPRPADSMPIHSGDQTMVRKSFVF